jgi:hypothetical protein
MKHKDEPRVSEVSLDTLILVVGMVLARWCQRINERCGGRGVSVV